MHSPTHTKRLDNIGSRARAILLELAARPRRRALCLPVAATSKQSGPVDAAAKAWRELAGAGLVTCADPARASITDAGKAWVARHTAATRATPVDPFVAQHLALETANIEGPAGRQDVIVDDSESPLGWLAKRRGRDGQPLIAQHQLAAGERLREEFTRAHMMPRVTANWQAAVTQGARASRDNFMPHASETIVSARQRVRAALDAAGPEFAGLLLDVCCFLKGLEAVERERLWPARSAKVVLQLGLDRLARHYGLGDAARGKGRVPMRAWNAAGIGV